MKEDLSEGQPGLEAVGSVEAPSAAGGSRVISRILPPAVRLWIQTQLDHVENLVFQLEGRDRQILSGYVPRVAIAADRAVYQGLHLRQARVQAREIRINLGQVLRGKPLRLLQQFPIAGDVVIQAADLNASLQAPLLRDGIRDFLRQLIGAQGTAHDLRPYLADLVGDATAPFQEGAVTLSPQQLSLTLLPTTALDDRQAVTLQTGLTVRQGRFLVLQHPRLLTQTGSAPVDLDDFELDLGPEVEIESLVVTAGQIEIRGSVQVIPAA